MSNQQQQGLPGQAPGAASLSLLVNAADNQNAARGSGAPGQGYQEALRRSLGDGVGPLHEELMRQKQAESLRQAAALHAQQNPGAGLLQQLSESQQLSQQLSHQLSQSDIRSALASAQLRQAPQLSNADLMALARSGAIPGLGGLLGGGGAAASLAGLGSGLVGGGFDQRLGELDLQGLEELERRQRMLAGLPPHLAGAGSLLAQAQQPQAIEPTEQTSAASAGGMAAASSPAGTQSMLGISNSGAKAPGVAGIPGDKSDQRRDPGSVVVPCRARGMPMDHNFKTAYFVIPENVRHGEELICSYFACRNAGVKFRYCSHCKVPVAKRNFRKRHRHGDTDKSKAIVDDDDESVSDNNNDNEADDIPSQVSAKMPAREGMTQPKNEVKLPVQQSADTLQQRVLQQNALQLSGVHQSALQQSLQPGALQQNAQQQLNAQVAAQLAAQEAAQLTAQQEAVQQLAAQEQASKLQDQVAQMQERATMASLPSQISSSAANISSGIMPSGSIDNNNGMLSAISQNAAAVATGAPLPAGMLGLPLDLIAKTTAAKNGASKPPPTGGEREKMIKERQRHWVTLLANRPYTSDATTMSAWLLEVLGLSDLTMPVDKSKYPDKAEDNEEEDDNDEGDDDEEEEEEEDEEGTERDINGGEAVGEADKGDVEENNDKGGKKECDSGSASVDMEDAKKGIAKDEKQEKEDIEMESENNKRGNPGVAAAVSFAEWRDRKKQKKVSGK